jgi:hypothetical protein
MRIWLLFVLLSAVFESFEENCIVGSEAKIAIDDDFELAFAKAVGVTGEDHGKMTFVIILFVPCKIKGRPSEVVHQKVFHYI